MSTEEKFKLAPKKSSQFKDRTYRAPWFWSAKFSYIGTKANICGIFSVLPLFQKAWPIFEQPKPSRNIQLLVDLQKIKRFSLHMTVSKKSSCHHVSDAAHHVLGKKRFIKILHVDLCLQRANKMSIELPAFDFDNTNFAYRRLAPCFISFFKLSGWIFWRSQKNRKLLIVRERHLRCGKLSA